MSRKPQQKEQIITGFDGYFSFLSNDYPTWVFYQGIGFPSVSTAFQAARTQDLNLRQKIANVTEVDQFRKIAIGIKNPSNWIEKRQAIMTILIRDKFKRNKQILDKLMATGQKTLLNTMRNGGVNEEYWGVFGGNGKNVLGKIIMKIRQQFAKGIDTKMWIQNNLNLESDTNMFADVKIDVLRQGKKVQTLNLNKNKSYYLFGSLKSVDFHLQNPTISRNHACIYFRNDLEVIIVDLNSSHGTFIKRKGKQKVQLQGLMSEKLYKDDLIQFGTSTREYIVSINRELVEKYVIDQQEVLKNTSKHTNTKDQAFQNLNQDEARKILGINDNSILVQGIKQKDNVQKIKQIFEKYQKVKSVRIKINKKTGLNDGIAIVYFESSSSVQSILNKIKQFHFKIRPIKQHDAQQILHNKNQRSRSKSRSRSREKKSGKN